MTEAVASPPPPPAPPAARREASPLLLSAAVGLAYLACLLAYVLAGAWSGLPFPESY